MRDMELRNLTVGSLLFGALKCYVLGSPKIVLDIKPRHVPRYDFTLPMLPCFCSAKIGEILKKIKNPKNI